MSYLKNIKQKVQGLLNLFKVNIKSFRRNRIQTKTFEIFLTYFEKFRKYSWEIHREREDSCYRAGVNESPFTQVGYCPLFGVDSNWTHLGVWVRFGTF